MNNKITFNIDEVLKMPDHSVTEHNIIRQIGLCSMLRHKLDKSIIDQLCRKVNPMYAYCGLYPEIIGGGPIEFSNEVDTITTSLLGQRENHKADNHKINKRDSIPLDEVRKILMQSRILKNASDELFNLFVETHVK